MLQWKNSLRTNAQDLLTNWSEIIYLVTGDKKSELGPIGIYGQRHRRHLHQNLRCLYNYLFVTGKLDTHLREIDHAANEVLAQLTKQMAAVEDVTEALKAADSPEWAHRMNTVQSRASEFVDSELIYT